MRPSLSLPVQLPAIFRRKAIAIAKSQTGVVQWSPARKTTSEDYPPPNTKSYRVHRMDLTPKKGMGLKRTFFFGAVLAAFLLPAGMIYSKTVGTKNKDYAALYPELFEGLEDDDDDAPAGTSALPPSSGEVISTVES